MSSYFAFVWKANEMESHRQTFFMPLNHTIPNDLCSKLAFYMSHSMVNGTHVHIHTYRHIRTVLSEVVENLLKPHKNAYKYSKMQTKLDDSMKIRPKSK